MKFDFYQAVFYALKDCEAIREYFQEDGINLTTIYEQQSSVIYDVASCSVGILFDRCTLASGEEGFSFISEKRRNIVGERWFIGKNKTYKTEKGKDCNKVTKKIINKWPFTLDRNLSDYEEDILL